jgi:hypothetical protein
MTEDDVLERYGISPRAEDMPSLRDLLRAEIDQADRADTELLKVLCVQLFAFGDVRDSLLIWRAKQSSFDAACSIDIQLVCGAGLVETKKFLAESDLPEAQDALQRLLECERAGDFDGFSVSEHLGFYRRYYGMA